MPSFSFTKNFKTSFFTLTPSGAPLSFQSGINSSNAVVWKTLPDNIWPPISALFSSTQIVLSRFFSLKFCASLIAVDSPDGPPPTMTTS